MLSFATEFPVAHKHSSADFLLAIRTWILGSPHTRLANTDLALMCDQLESRTQKNNESLDTLRARTAVDELAATRYTRRDDGIEWMTTVVFSRTVHDSWVGIRVSCESSHAAVRLPLGKKPVLVRTLLESLGGASDGPVRVTGSPVRLEDADIDVAADLITGRSRCRLPIVYISVGFHGAYVVDCDRLSRELAGMAHVVVEPNRPFSLRLKAEVRCENVYGGTVGVYWPDTGGRRSFFLGREFESPEQVAQAVFQEIQTALTNRRPFDRCTWAYVQEAASRQTIQALRDSGSQELEKYIETFDVELKAKTHRLQDAEREIARLHKELRIHESRLAACTGSLLHTGAEQDLYPSEVLGIVRDAIADAKSRVPRDSRREHVLAAVLVANPSGEDTATSMREQLKELLRGTRGVDANSKRTLKEMGFSIADDGKHFKLVFRDDDRYTFTLAKTGSDWRGGLNAASDIARLLF